MKTSEETDKIALAFVAAWTELTNPPKDGKANYGRYTTLPALLDHIKGPLTANGIAVVQEAVTTDLGVGCLTRLVHTSGQFYEFGPLLFPGGDTPQKGGSAETYARRYQLSAAVGLAADEDDDGAKASKSSESGTRHGSGNEGTGATQSEPPPPASVPSTSSSGTAGAPPEETATPTGGDGEGPSGGVATPEQRTRLLAIYKKPSMVKEKAVELFGYGKPADVTLLELSSAEVEALILEAAS